MKAKDILGLNARYLNLIRPENKPKKILQADNKIAFKKILEKAHIPTPKIFQIFANMKDVEEYDWKNLPNSFVIKPNTGFGGGGIMVVYAKKKNYWVDPRGNEIFLDDIKLHILDILDGSFSLHDEPDIAFLEQKVKTCKAFKKLVFRGTPDIRLIVYNKVPVMAMLRLPTEESGGRANLHQGAIGVGIEIASGITTRAFWKGRYIKRLPGTKIKLHGIKIPEWDRILELASESQSISGLGFAGVDIVIDKTEGPQVLEINARPGLEIQNVNFAPLLKRIRRVEDLKIKTNDKAVRVAKELFAGEIEKDEDDQTGKKILGFVEPVTIFGKNKKKMEVLARIDTGAGFSSIDEKLVKELGFEKTINLAKNIRKIKNPSSLKLARPKDLEQVEKLMKIPGVVDTALISSSHGITRRIMINLKIILKKKKILSKISVISRKNLRYRVILGRRDLKGFVVDPSRKSTRL